jgi:hypothetical protein
METGWPDSLAAGEGARMSVWLKTLGRPSRACWASAGFCFGEISFGSGILKFDGNGWAEKITWPEIEIEIVGKTDGAIIEPDDPE